MRHTNTGRKFNRDTNARKALLRGLCKNLIEREQIKTTLPKAKDLRGVVEKMITRAKVDSVANRRLIAAELGNDDKATTKLFKVLGPRFANRAGGYTRVLKAGFRYGDAAPMAIIEFVERDVNAKKQPVAAKKDDKAAKEKSAKVEKETKAEKTPRIAAPKVKDTKPAAAKPSGGTKAVAVKRRATGK